jgi:hypothetical protein
MRARGVLLVAILATVMGAGIALAAAPPPPVSCGTADCTITVTDPIAGSPSSPGTSTPGTTVEDTCIHPTGPGVPADLDCQGCHWEKVAESDLAPSDSAYLKDHPDGAYYLTRCFGADGMPIFCPCVPVYQPGKTTPGGKAKPAADLAASVTFPLPSPRLGTSPAGYAYVGTPTYLFIDPDDWKPITKTASDGPTSVTATAKPYKVLWDSGDRSGRRYVTCDGPGRSFSPTVDGAHTPIDDLRPPCGYRYRATSSGGTQLRAGDERTEADKVLATVSWKIRWTCSGSCDAASGSLPDLTSSGSTYRVVYQLQSLNCTGTACGRPQGAPAPPTAPGG